MPMLSTNTRSDFGSVLSFEARKIVASNRKTTPVNFHPIEKWASRPKRFQSDRTS